jgi:hypothetical protein
MGKCVTIANTCLSLIILAYTRKIYSKVDELHYKHVGRYQKIHVVK